MKLDEMMIMRITNGHEHPPPPIKKEGLKIYSIIICNLNLHTDTGLFGLVGIRY